MPNMAQAISKHNSKVIKQNQDRVSYGCNCKKGVASCPLNGVCLTKGVVYEATVSRGDNKDDETYTGLTARCFKTRLNEHTADFNNQNRKRTYLSKFIWKLKRGNIHYEISWKLLQKCPSFNPSTKTCKLCLQEKYLIMFRPEGATLNRRSEFFATCRHRLKPLLANT